MMGSGRFSSPARGIRRSMKLRGRANTVRISVRLRVMVVVMIVTTTRVVVVVVVVMIVMT